MASHWRPQQGRHNATDILNLPGASRYAFNYAVGRRVSPHEPRDETPGGAGAMRLCMSPGRLDLLTVCEQRGSLVPQLSPDSG
eukprot:scaffold8421_cov114-Isochrysis_galbana.AAC.17